MIKRTLNKGVKQLNLWRLGHELLSLLLQVFAKSKNAKGRNLSFASQLVVTRFGLGTSSFVFSAEKTSFRCSSPDVS